MDSKKTLWLAVLVLIVACPAAGAHINTADTSCEDDGVAHWHPNAPGPGGCISVPTHLEGVLP